MKALFTSFHFGDLNRRKKFELALIGLGITKQTALVRLIDKFNESPTLQNEIKKMVVKSKKFKGVEE